MGRKKQFERGDGLPGAPQITIRLEPEAMAYLKSREEGPRAYLEALIQADRDGSAIALPVELAAFAAGQPGGAGAFIQNLLRELAPK